MAHDNHSGLVMTLTQTGAYIFAETYPLNDSKQRRYSWEPQPNLEECIRLMESFWSDIGLDNKRYSVGFEVKASEEWIGMCIKEDVVSVCLMLTYIYHPAKERKYFWHNFGKEFGVDARTKLQNQNPPQDKDKNKDSKDKTSVPAGKAVKTKAGISVLTQQSP